MPSLPLTRFVSLLILGMCLTGATLARATDITTPFSADYQVTRNGSKIGERTHVLDKHEKGYLYEARMRTTGLAALLKPARITERSYWSLSDNRVQPQQYEYLDSSDDSRTAKLQFDWSRRHVTNDIGDEPWGMTVPAGTQDKFGYMLALMQDLQQGNTTPEYQVADGGLLKTYRFTYEGKMVLDTALGKLETVKLRRIRAGKEDRKVFIWCAPALGYLPVRIERHKKGTVYTMLIQKMEGR
mgnify:CR=1 FL=1